MGLAARRPGQPTIRRHQIRLDLAVNDPRATTRRKSSRIHRASPGLRHPALEQRTSRLSRPSLRRRALRQPKPSSPSPLPPFGLTACVARAEREERPTATCAARALPGGSRRRQGTEVRVGERMARGEAALLEAWSTASAFAAEDHRVPIASTSYYNLDDLGEVRTNRLYSVKGECEHAGRSVCFACTGLKETHPFQLSNFQLNSQASRLIHLTARSAGGKTMQERLPFRVIRPSKGALATLSWAKVTGSLVKR
ncbi:hypothetical protein ZWY2020_023686 [Hordeum vulgare]|nr:hypothetical protein ZWY2020_023686 [Hordeum vulgare]